MSDNIFNITSTILAGGTGDGSEIQTILYSVLNTFMGIALILTIISIVRASIRYHNAADEESTAKAWKHLKNCIISLFILSAAEVGTNIIVSQVKAWIG